MDEAHVSVHYTDNDNLLINVLKPLYVDKVGQGKDTNHQTKKLLSLSAYTTITGDWLSTDVNTIAWQKDFGYTTRNICNHKSSKSAIYTYHHQYHPTLATCCSTIRCRHGVAGKQTSERYANILQYNSPRYNI